MYTYTHFIMYKIIYIKVSFIEAPVVAQWALIWPLAWELPYARVAPKRKT